MTPTEAAICKLSHELYGVSEEQALAAVAQPGAPGVALVEAGLLTAEQADAVLERAFESLAAPTPKAADTGGAPPSAPESAPAAAEVPGLRELLGRIQAIVEGRVAIAAPAAVVAPGRRAPKPAVSASPASLPPMPLFSPAFEEAHDSPALDALDDSATLVGVDDEEAPQPALGAAPALNELALQNQLTDDAVARWAIAERDVSSEAVEAARQAPESLGEALVAAGEIKLTEAVEVLEGCRDLVCGECRSRFTLGDALVAYGCECPCPGCQGPLEAGGNSSATVSLSPQAKPASLTKVPDYTPGGRAEHTETPGYAEGGQTRALVKSASLEGELSLAAGGLGNYELMGELARGGMGIVYKARQRSLKRIVCLKVMRSAELASADDRRRFLREAEASARLHHPGIVPIHEVGEHRGQCFFSMDFVEGRELGHHARQLSPSVRELVEIMILVCDAIHYAHQRGIIHRDLKPANIMIDADSAPHVMDFGIAKRQDTQEDSKHGPMTQEGEIMGTPHYMAPEQAEGRVSEIDVRSDVYALGVICYELLAGKRPFSDDNILSLLKKVVNDEPQSLRVLKPDLDPDLETIVLKAMEKEKSRRYQTALALKEELQRWLDGEAIEARRATVIYRTRKWATRNKWVALTGVAGLVGILLIAGLWATVWLGSVLARKREVSGLVAMGTSDMKARRFEQAFNRFGRALSVDARDSSARAGRVDAALAWAREAVAARRAGEAETVLRQVEYLGLRTGAIELALADAQAERRRLVEVGVERQQRFIEATQHTLARLEEATADRELPLEEERAFVFDLVRHRDPETVKILRAVLAESERGRRTRAVVARALGWIGEPSAVPELVSVVRDHTLTVELVLAAAEALGQIGGEDAWEALIEARESRGSEFRRRTQRAVRRVAVELGAESAAGEGSERVASLFARADRLRLAADHAEAVDAYGEAIEAAPNAVEGYLGRGLSLLALGRLDLAERDLDRVVQAGGATAGTGRLNRAEVRRRRGNADGALDDLDVLLSSSPRADAHLAKGRILLAQSRAREAVGEFSKALAQQEGYADAYASRAEAHLALRESDDALSDATLALKSDPGRAAFRMVRGRVQFARGALAAAAEDAAQAVSLDPALAAGYRFQAKIAQRRGDVGMALRALRRGWGRTGDEALRVERCRVLLGANRAGEALEEAGRVLAKDPDAVEARMLRGVAALQLGEAAAAVSDLQRVVAAAPRLAPAHYNLACALAQAGQREAALGALEQAVGFGHPRGPSLRDDQDLAPLHGAERFEALAAAKKN